MHPLSAPISPLKPERVFSKRRKSLVASSPSSSYDSGLLDSNSSLRSSPDSSDDFSPRELLILPLRRSRRPPRRKKRRRKKKRSPPTRSLPTTPRIPSPTSSPLYREALLRSAFSPPSPEAEMECFSTAPFLQPLPSTVSFEGELVGEDDFSRTVALGDGLGVVFEPLPPDDFFDVISKQVPIPKPKEPPDERSLPDLTPTDRATLSKMRLYVVEETEDPSDPTTPRETVVREVGSVFEEEEDPFVRAWNELMNFQDEYMFGVEN